MGVFMASVAFRRPDLANWTEVKAKIEELCDNPEGLVNNLREERNGYAIVSPYGDMGEFLAENSPKISRLTGGYVIMTVCVDSDFAILEVYYNGKLLERSCIGELYEHLQGMEQITNPDVEIWKPMLVDLQQIGVLKETLSGRALFVEDQLRKLSELVELPIFDNSLVFGDIEL